MTRMILTRLLILALLAVSPSGQVMAQTRQVVNIDNDRGGNVLKAIKRRNELQKSGRTVRIRGYCRSACTIYLSLPNACLGPKATVGFHAPRLPGTRIIPPLVGEMMGQFYRGEIRRRWFTDWQYSLNMHKMTAAQYKQLDPQIRICGSGQKKNKS